MVLRFKQSRWSSAHSVLCCAAILVLATGEVARAALVPEIDLSDKSYALTVGITISSSKTSLLRFDVEELHSAWQRRTIMKYRTESRIVERRLGARVPRVGSFYASDQREVLLVGEWERSCQGKDHEFVDQVFNLNALSGVAADQAEAQPHLIGASRLLAFVNANRNKFSLLSNMGVMRFISERIMPGDFTLLLVYRNVANENLAHGIPRSILINKGDSVIYYDFTRYIPIPENQPHFGTLSKSNLLAEEYQTSDQTIMFDLFAWKRAMGCAAETAHSKQTDNPSLAGSSDSSRFSFTARFKLMQLREPMEMMVGYEPALSTLKVERQSESSSVRILVDYRNDRSFHMLDRKARNDMVFSQILDDTTGELSCVATQISDSNSRFSQHREPPTLGQLLLGTQRLTYLGVARVRGVEARAYEAHDCEWPIWFEQPIIYIDNSPEASITSRPGGGGGFYKRQISGTAKSPKAKLPYKLNSVFYFTRRAGSGSDDPNQGDILDSSLLLVEVFKLTGRNQVLDQIPIHIYDHSWALNRHAPNNQRWEDFFSLGDQCLASASQLHASSSSQHLHIDLLLENNQLEPPQQVGWLGESTRRNLAILRSAQDHFLRSTMIFNINSRWFPSQGAGPRELMSATMEAAERTRDRASMVYQGSASLRSGVLVYEKFKIFMSFSMQSCSMFAAHRGLNRILFAFDTLRSTCFILKDEKVLAESSRAFLDKVFDFNDNGVLEVYEVEHLVKIKPTGGDLLASLSQYRDRLVRVEYLYMIDPISLVTSPRGSLENGHGSSDSGSDDHNDASKRETKQRRSLSPQQVRASLRIKQFEVSPLGALDTLGDPSQLGAPNKFSGIGLVAEDHQSRLVSPSRPSDGSTTMLEQSLNMMTFERCQTACLAELDCKSFSVCTLKGATECLVSTAAIDTPFVARQLISLVEKRGVKFGTSFTIDLLEDADESGTGAASNRPTLRIRRQPSCELHSKLYSDLFEPRRRRSISLAQRIYRPVTDFEHCAKMCFDWTREHLLAQNSRQVEASEPVGLAGRGELGLAGPCERFFYVDHIDVLQVSRRMRGGQSERAIDFMLGEQKVGGYCVFDRLPDGTDNFKQIAISGADAELVAGAKFFVHEYEFDFKFLFEQQFGWSLNESPKTDHERYAYEELLHSQHDEDETRELVKTLSSLLDRGDNWGYWLEELEAGECARICFNQNKRVWPACRSFDFFEVSKKADSQKSFHCAFNSITLRQALKFERFDLVRQGEDQERLSVERDAEVRVWHFEPKQGLVIGSMNEAYRVGPEEFDLGENGPSGSLRLSSLNMLGVIFMALVIGLVFGIRMGSWGLKLRRDSVANDLKSLVDIVERHDNNDVAQTPERRLDA